MNCNCNNINNTDGSGLTAYISHVYGNVLRLAIPLTLRTVTMENGEMVATDTDFIPSSDYPVTVVFSKGGVKISLEATMQNGNIAYIEDLGTIPVGKYDIAVLCKDDNGNPYRFKQVTALHIVDATADANIPSDIEYEVTTWYLDAAIFLALKGEDGVGIDDIITESSGEIGGMNTVTIVLTNGETRTFTVMNGSGQVDSDFNINSPHPLSNSTITAKINAIDSSIEGLFGNVDYDSQSKTIRFYNKDRSRVLATLDARPFIKDGMVNSVYISNNTLVITFNTDAGREAIGVSLSSIFNPNNYYTKTQVNNLLGNYYDKEAVNNFINNKADVLNDGRIPAIEATPVVLDSIYAPPSGSPIIPINPQAGEVIYFANEHKIRRYYNKNSGQSGGIPAIVYVEETPSKNVVYYNKDDEKFYRYDVGLLSMVEIETGGGYEPPVGGIPKSDLASDVQTSLGKADTALQSQEQADWNESDNSDPAFIKNKPTIPDVSNLATKSEVQGKANASDVYTKSEVDSALELKQGNITDLEQIRAGATLGASSYQKPNNGIPASDLADGVIPDVSGFVTSSDVADAVADLVDSAPSTLDTLNELAAALGDDPNFATTISTALGNKVDKVTGKGLSTEDYTTAEKSKLEGLSNYDDTALQAAVAGKVDKETGKSLMTDAERTKLSGIAAGAEVNVQADWEQTTTTADDYIKNKPDVPTAISVNQQSYPLNNNHAFVIPDYYTKTQIDNAGFVTSQRTLINMDVSNGLVFTDADNNTLTHAQVISILHDTTKDVVIAKDFSDTDDPEYVQLRLYQTTDEGNDCYTHRFGSIDVNTSRWFYFSIYEDDGVLSLDEAYYDGLATSSTLATVATSGSYNDLSNKPTIPTVDSTPTQNSTNAVQSGGVYTALSGKANTADLAGVATSGSYNDLTNKPSIPAAQVNADWNASSGVMEILNKPTIPTKFSDLVDDSDYITAQDVASIVVGSADVVITETASHINITFVTTSISFTPNTTMSLWAGQKVGTLTVSGTHLKQDITLTVPANFTAQVSGGTAAQSITIPQTGGEVTGVSVTITYTGADTDSYNGSITATSGSTTASVGLVYSQYQGATIIAGTIGTINAAIGSPQIGELNVSGVNLEGDISASVGNGDFTICATQNGTYGTTATISKASAEAPGGATLYVKYTPSSGTSTASGTLTLTTPKDGSTTTESVSLQGAVSTLTLSTNSVSISTDQNVAATGTFTINGSNLTNGVTLALTDANSVFSLSKNSLTKAEAEAGETITVTYNSSAAGNHSGSIAVNWDGTTQTVSLSGTAAVAATSDAEGKFTKLDANGNTLYLKRAIVNNEKTTDVEVHQSNYDTAWNGTVADTYGGNIVIPATVVVDGVTCNVVKIAANAFRYAKNGSSGKTKLQSLTLPEGITTIGGYFLYQAQAITSVVIPSTVTTLGGGFCSQATNLETVDMQCAHNPSFQTTFGDQNNGYFINCSKLKSFVFPDKVESIVAGAGNYGSFYNCSAVTEITLGTNMATMRGIFQQMTNVTKIYCRGTTVIPKCNATASTTDWISSTVYENAQVYVPTGYKQAYLDVVDGRTANGKVWYPFEQYHALIEYDPD